MQNFKTCGKSISSNNISKHLEHHKKFPNECFSKQRYKLDHDDLYCKFCNKKCKNKNSLINHEMRCKENVNRLDINRTNFNNFGRIVWNKGLTKDTDDRVKQNGLSISQTHQKGIGLLFGDSNPSRRDEVRKKISKTCLQKSRLKQWHSVKLKKYEYNGSTFDSSWEVSYAKYLDKNNISWIRNTQKFEYIYQDKIKHYIPDFYLPDQNLYVEIKGYEFCPEMNRCKYKYFPNKLVILYQQELKDLNIIK